MDSDANGALEGTWQSEAAFEINAAGQRCIVSQPKFTEWPRPAEGEEAGGSSLGRDVEHAGKVTEPQRSAWELVRDGEEVAFDWEGGLDAFDVS